ncbi:MAG: insulinase family protein [Oscillospiraceae bacterium]|jgi:predicted Zn-dependent peptidase|nr:insulinase family protein [Oscillospiraceae bacterium]
MDRIDFPDVRETLVCGEGPGGLPIFVVPKPGYRKTYAMLAVNYGSVDVRFAADGIWRDTPAGVAHFLEHKMFDMPDGENALQAFARTGASPNAFTSHAMTAYHFACTDRFEENLRTLLRFVSTPYFTKESVDKEQGIIGQEIRMTEDNPHSQVYENLLAALYGAHPVRLPIAGTAASIAGIDAEMLRDCHATFYRSAHMCLCVAGDVDPARVEAVAGAVWPAVRGPALTRDYGAPSWEAARGGVSRTMEVARPLFALGALCAPPAPGTETLRFELLGELAMEALTGPASPLYKTLYEKGLINRDYGYGLFRVPGGACLVAVGESPEPDAVRAALFDEVARLGQDGMDAARFERLKRAALGARLRQMDAPEALCRLQADAHFAHARYFDVPALFDTLTPDAARAFLCEAFVPARAALSVVAPVAAHQETR